MEVYDCMVKQLPAGCRLTAIFDACHSGSAMNLPYMYSTKGTVKEPNFAAGAGKALLTAGMGYAKDGNTGGALSSLFGAAKTMFNEKQAGDLLRQQNTSEADVISWSGCKDDQTVSARCEDRRLERCCSHCRASEVGPEWACIRRATGRVQPGAASYSLQPVHMPQILFKVHALTSVRRHDGGGSGNRRHVVRVRQGAHRQAQSELR